MECKTVIKLNNIPHGFYEDQMRSYFAQFGTVKHVLLIRSKKTHNSRGFGFVEFNMPQVARAAAEAMHNYLLFNNVLKCRQMDKNDLPKDFFKQSFKGQTNLQKMKKRHNIAQRDDTKVEKHYRKLLKVQRLLKDMGIPFECRIINHS